MNTTSIVAVRLDDVELRDDPIDPAWICEGAPVARSGQWATSADRTTTTHVWDCTAGRFDWHFGVDEIVHIVEGSVIVSSADSEPRTLRAGDRIDPSVGGPRVRAQARRPASPPVAGGAVHPEGGGPPAPDSGPLSCADLGQMGEFIIESAAMFM